MKVKDLKELVAKTFAVGVEPHEAESSLITKINETGYGYNCTKKDGFMLAFKQTDTCYYQLVLSECDYDREVFGEFRPQQTVVFFKISRKRTMKTTSWSKFHTYASYEVKDLTFVEVNKVNNEMTLEEVESILKSTTEKIIQDFKSKNEEVKKDIELLKSAHSNETDYQIIHRISDMNSKKFELLDYMS